MSKTTEITNFTITIEYECPKTNQMVTKVIKNIYDLELDYSSDDCELCGSHGHIAIDINNCTSCKKHHEISVRSW